MPFQLDSSHCLNFHAQGKIIHSNAIYSSNLSCAFTSNGKIDKRVLRQMIADTEARKAEVLALKADIKANLDIAVKTLNEKIEVVSVQPARLPVDAIVWSDIPTLAAPPPVYQKNSGGSTSSDSSSTDSHTLASSSSSVTEKVEVSSVEKGDVALAWEGYEDEDLPNKTQGKYIRNIRHQVFSLYRRLFWCRVCHEHDDLHRLSCERRTQRAATWTDRRC